MQCSSTYTNDLYDKHTHTRSHLRERRLHHRLRTRAHNTCRHRSHFVLGRVPTPKTILSLKFRVNHYPLRRMQRRASTLHACLPSTGRWVCPPHTCNTFFASTGTWLALAPSRLYLETELVSYSRHSAQNNISIANNKRIRHASSTGS